MVVHEIYGLRAASNLELPGVAPSASGKSVDLRIQLGTFPAFTPDPVPDLYSSSAHRPNGQPTVRVATWQGGAYFGFFYADGVRFAIDREGRQVWGDWPEGYSFEDACTYLVGPICGFVLRLRGIACLHASAIALDGRAIVFSGSAGAGKSTLAAAFAKSGYPVISDDIVALIPEGHEFFVPPGYPRVNLWTDSTRVLFGTEEALPSISPGWTKRFLPLDKGGQFETRRLPLGAIYILQDRDPALSTTAVQELAGADALVLLLGNSYYNRFADSELLPRNFDVFSRVAASVPVRGLRSTANPARIWSVCEAIAADAKRVTASAP